jgi:predicted nucleic acid-binding protein
MTSFSNPERGLDVMLVVYSLLQGHPAALPCEQFLRARTGWFTTALTLLEIKAILTKVYAVDHATASQKLAQFAGGPLAVADVDGATVLAAMYLADTLRVDLTDAVLLHTAQARGAAWLATDDQKLAQVCGPLGFTPETPLDAGLRQQIAAWEAANLPVKGLPRILRQIHHWLNQNHPQAAQDFWSQTGSGSHLP